MEDFFRWLGEQFGDAIRWIVETLTLAFTGIDDFITGLTSSLGMSPSLFGLALLVVGLLLLYGSMRRLLRGRWVGGLLQLGLALLLLGWLIN